MRKNMYNNDILMINSVEIVFLQLLGTQDSDLKQICRDFNKMVFKDSAANNSVGINVNKLDAISKDIIEGLKIAEGNVNDDIFLDTVKEACLDALMRNQVELALELADILEEEYKGNPIVCKKEKLLENRNEVLVNYLLAYQDTDYDIEKDKEILYYENGEVYKDYNVEKAKTKSLKS